MNHLHISILFYLTLIFSQSINAQSGIIAKIGNKELTKDEFKNRYELSPRIISDDFENTDSLKLKFLYSLIAEKLWSMEAVDKGLAASDVFNFYFTPIEKLYIRDEVFRLEIKDKVQVTDEDRARGISKYVKILKIKSIASNDSSKIANLYSDIMTVGSIDSLSIISPVIIPLISEFEIKFGDLNDEIIEDQLYNLKINEFTEPIKNGKNWFIFELKNIKLNIPEVSQNKLEDDVENIMRNRRTRNLYDEFYKKHFGGFSIKADDELFIEISEAFFRVIISYLNSLQQEDMPEKYYLSEKDINKVKEILGAEFLDRNLFNTKYSPVKVYDFLSDLTIVDVEFEEVNQSSVNKVLSNELKRFMQQETIYQIGIEMGVQYSEDVKSQLELWRDNLLAQIWKNDLNNQIKITEGEIEQYYNDSLSDSLQSTNVNLQVIHAIDLNQVRAILNLLEKGKGFDQIAKELDSSQGLYVENISDFNKLKKYGQSAYTITELDSGQIFGPIKTESGYSLVKVVERSMIPDSIKAKIDKQRDNVSQKIFFQKLNKLLEDKTIELANKYGITISEDFIYFENYSEVNLFAHKYPGFGGRISAVPFTTPFFKWFNQWKTNSKINP
jgi:hypothetical protein